MSLDGCMIRFEEKTSLAREDGELHQEEGLPLPSISNCTREEREAGGQHRRKENQNQTRITVRRPKIEIYQESVTVLQIWRVNTIWKS